MPGSAPCFCVPPSSGLPGCANAPVPVTHAHAPHFGTPYASWYPLKCESWWVPECESWYPPKFRSAGSAHKAAGRRVVGKTAAFRYPPKYASWYPPKFVSWYPPKCGWARRLAKQPARRRGEVPLPADTPHFAPVPVAHHAAFGTTFRKLCVTGCVSCWNTSHLARRFGFGVSKDIVSADQNDAFDPANRIQGVQGNVCAAQNDAFSTTSQIQGAEGTNSSFRFVAFGTVNRIRSVQGNVCASASVAFGTLVWVRSVEGTISTA